ncbi:MAG: D-alanine--D-alanine ligase [Bacteroidales bacterium]
MEIALLTGGNSSEYSISVKTGNEIQKWLVEAGYKSHIVLVKGEEWHVKNGKELIPFNRELFSFKNGKKNIKIDYVWNAIHGTPGENGLLQGYLDMKNIPYSSSGHLASAMTFNKYVAKTYLRQFGIMTAEAALILRDKTFDIDEIIENVGLPCFVKPNNGGSSFGTTKVTQIEKMKSAIDKAFMEDNEVIIESFVKGREITCGLLKTKKRELIFPLTEIIPKTEFFTFEAKYEGMADEITPAEIDEDLAKRCMQLSSEIYDYTHCKGIVRVDFIVRGNQIYFLELNTIPGMSKESIVPQQIRAMGIKVEEVLREVIEDTME